MRCTVTNPEQSITDFLKDPHYSAFLVPSVYSTVHRQALTAAGFKTSWQATTSGHLHFHALRVHIGRRGPERLNNLRTALTALFGETERLETIEGRIRDQILPIVVPTDVSVAIDRPKAEKSEDEKRERKAITAYLPLLTRLAQISGRAFVFHASRKQTMQPHPEDGHVHIYTNACPPGESDFWYIDTAFGLEIAAGSKERPIGFGPTEGRGQVLVEEDEKTLVQILDNNWRNETKNGYDFHIDVIARPREVVAELTDGPIAARSRRAQAQAGQPDRRPGDDGGHFIAARFNGPGDSVNHFAQDRNFNRGAYRAMEDGWARNLRDGKRVVVHIVPLYEGTSKRPYRIHVTWRVNGREEFRDFSNESKVKPRDR